MVCLLSVAVISVLGIVAAIALTVIVVREHKWQAWYVQRFNALPGVARAFPEDKPCPGSVEKQPWGFISKVVVTLGCVIVVAWIAIGVFLWNRRRAHQPRGDVARCSAPAAADASY